MKKKIFVICLLFVSLIVSSNFSSAVSSNNLEEKEKKITVEINKYENGEAKKLLVELNPDKAEQLKSYLIALDDALERDDGQDILKYQNLIDENGLIGENNIEFKPKNPESFLKIKNMPLTKNLFSSLSNQSDGNITNFLCYFHARGHGTMLFTTGLLLFIPTIFLVSAFGENVLKILIPLYLIIALFTHLVPFRVGLPIGLLMIKGGSASAIGVNGYQKVEIENSSQIMVVGFTGITISIPFVDTPQDEYNGFMFVSGFSLMARTTVNS